MKKNKFLILLILAFLKLESSAQQYDCIVNGQIDTTFNTHTVRLYTLNNKKANWLDTATIKHGNFSFNVNPLAYPPFVKLVIDDYDYCEMGFFVEKGIVNMKIDKVARSYQLSGTPLNELYQLYLDSCFMYSKEANELFVKEDGGVIKNETTKTEIIKGGKIAKIYEKWGGYTVSFKKNNIDNIVGQTLFKDNLEGSMSEFIWGHGTDSAFQVIYNAADEKLKSDPLVLDYLRKRTNERKLKSKRVDLIGKRFFDITLISPTEKKDKLSNYIGKYDFVLVDFWASWCNPCVKAMPELKIIYDKYKKNGLKVIAISMDDNQKSWLNRLNKLDAPWSQFMINGISKELGLQLNNSYGLRGVPYCVLIDKKGNILYVGDLPDTTALDILLKR